ncbi:hypothetical protein D1007_02916 [Hordeum vulgare]|nr:hypothetical protein D1007_02916 [Hordeum vulgare]
MNGRLQAHSTIDALGAGLDVNLRDCALLVRTVVMSDCDGSAVPAMIAATPAKIGHVEAKSRAVDWLLDATRRASSLLTAPAPKAREKAAMVICRLCCVGIPLIPT